MPPNEAMMSDERRNHGEDLKVPPKPGQPPRPATEPNGSEGSSKAPGTETDPATGETTRQRGSD
jgi:hypothetical protein